MPWPNALLHILLDYRVLIRLVAEACALAAPRFLSQSNAAQAQALFPSTTSRVPTGLGAGPDGSTATGSLACQDAVPELLFRLRGAQAGKASQPATSTISYL